MTLYKFVGFPFNCCPVLVYGIIPQSLMLTNGPHSSLEAELRGEKVRLDCVLYVI